MNKIAKTQLSPNHGLDPKEVQLYRLLRLTTAPSYILYMNSVTGKELLKNHENWNALMGLKKKGYVAITWHPLSNAQVLEIIK